MINIKQAQDIISQTIKPLEKTEVPLTSSLDYILCENIKAVRDIPPFNKSAMDGFVILSDDNSDKYRIIDTIPAGRYTNSNLQPGTCYHIMTGAPVPWDSAKIVKKEITIEQDGFMSITQTDNKNHLCMQGEDIKAGDTVIKVPVKITPEIMGVLASVGIASVPVFKKPAVSIIASGDELINPGEEASPAMIYNANSYILTGKIIRNYAVPVDIGVVRDNKTSLTNAIIKALDSSDIVLISGGASVGDYDYTLEAFESLSCELLFTQVAIKPGKPTLFAKKDDKYIFGLPGNPVAAAIVFDLFIRQAIHSLQGLSYDPFTVRALLEKDIKIKRNDGRALIRPVRIIHRDDEIFAAPVKMNGPADVIAFQKADGFVIVKPDAGIIKSDTHVNVALM